MDPGEPGITDAAGRLIAGDARLRLPIPLRRLTCMKNVVVFAICFCLVFCGIPAQAQNTSDSGYFLSLKQKGQLIATGEIKDDQGRRYDIMIVPGYEPPLNSGWKGLKKSGRNLMEFFHAKKYRRLARNSKAALKWSFKDCLWKFTLKGAGKVWKRDFKDAAKTSQIKAFGWWLAYPWAFVRATADNAYRIPAGIIGTAGGTAGGLVLTPAYYMVNSPVKAAWNGGVTGLAVPAVKVAWNTAVAPPMAFLGQKPTPNRVDNFWVKEIKYRGVINQSLSEDNAKLMIRLGRDLLKSTESVDKEKETVRNEFDKRWKDLNMQQENLRREQSEQLQKFNSQETRIIRDFRLTSAYESLAKTYSQGKCPPNIAKENLDRLSRALNDENDLDKATRSRMLRLLQQYFPEALPGYLQYMQNTMTPGGYQLPPR
jgi:hypothetical protein